MNGAEMKAVHTAAGLRVAESAKLFRVAITTAMRWFQGAKKPKQMVTYEIAVNITKMIQKAIDKGLLPVSDDIKGDDRFPVISAAIKSASK